MADRSEQSSSNNSRKRKRNPEEWKKNKRKSLCNKGKEYETVSKSGEKRTFAAKQLGKDCRCPLKCFERVTQERREIVFGGFWELGDWTAQNAFLCGSVKVTSVKKRYAKKGETSLHSRRNYSRQYYINDNGMSTRVCKKAFLAIYAISSGRLSRALSKMQSVGSRQTDQRGRHEPENKTPEEDVQFVQAHIQAFPTESRHYCRKDNPNRAPWHKSANVSTG